VNHAPGRLQVLPSVRHRDSNGRGIADAVRHAALWRDPAVDVVVPIVDDGIYRGILDHVDEFIRP